MRIVASALLVLAMTAPHALAAASRHDPCTVVTDSAGDVTTADQLLTVPDGHVDLRGVALRTTTSAVVVTMADSALTEQRRGVWRVQFDNGRIRYAVIADLGMWVNGGNAVSGRPFRAGVAGRPATAVAGSVDYVASRITVTVPFGVLRAGRGAQLTRFVVDAGETFVNAAPSPAPVSAVGVIDTASSTMRYVVGSGC